MKLRACRVRVRSGSAMRWAPALLFGLGLLLGLNLRWASCADLLDLYVQHMDETMGTRARKIMGHERLQLHHRQRQQQQLPQVILQRRQARSVLESPSYRVADPAKQSLSISDLKPRGKRIHEKLTPNFLNQAWQNSDDTYFSFKNQRLTESRNPQSSLGEKEVMSNYQTSPFFEGTFLPRTAKKGRTPKKFQGARKKSIYATNKRLKRNDDTARTFSRLERLDDDGDITLEWDPNENENVTFRLSAKTLGYVGLGFNDQSHMVGADVVLAWVDDDTRETMLLDSHGVDNAIAETDLSKDVELIHGSQNETHTVITFRRKWQACDPQDRTLTGDTMRVFWVLHPHDPELNSARFDGGKRGNRALRLKSPPPHSPPVNGDPDIIKWDIKLSQYTVKNSSDTIYWCKIFKAPVLNRTHHMIGYTPLIEKANEAVVHHVIVYECASTASILTHHAKLAGADCYSPTMPKEWDSCLQPVLAWARGSRGEWLPEHVGLPIAEHLDNSYYMLEVHYNNKLGKHVFDSSGVRLHLTPNVRPMEAGILVAGVAVSPMHMVPPQQKEYATAGYCTSQCTNEMFDKEGINVVSVVLHSHLAGRRLSVKHIREGQELAPIVQDRRFDFEYQQPYTLGEEVKVLPGDELVAECVYDTRGRQKPTFGGYAAYQEMCLAFIVHYPRTPLAACYSMTPVKEFFNALNVQSFKDRSMNEVENLFFMSTTTTATLPVSPNHHSGPRHDIRSNEYPDSDIIKQTKSASISKGEYIDYDKIFDQLVIDKPDEFKDHTLSDHISALAWNDSALSKSIEMSLYHGKHMTFCRTREDRVPQATSIQMFPNYTALPESNETFCKEYRSPYGSSNSAVNLISSLVVVVVTISIAVHL